MLKRDGDPNQTDPAPTTYHALAQAGIALDEAGGRFGAQPKVIGATPNPAQLYPPASVPNADIGIEPELGDDLAPEPVGTPAEVAASIAQREAE
jgi:hypothetical protein